MMPCSPHTASTPPLGREHGGFGSSSGTLMGSLVSTDPMWWDVCVVWWGHVNEADGATLRPS